MVLAIDSPGARNEFTGFVETLIADVNVCEVDERADGDVFPLAGAPKTTDGHVNVGKFEARLAGFGKGFRVVGRDLDRLLDATFGCGKIVTLTMGKREVEKMRWITRVLPRGLSK